MTEENKKQKTVYILVSTYDYADDGYSIIGIFSTLHALREFVTKKYPDFKKEKDGNYIFEHKGKLSSNTYLTIYEEPLRGIKND